jgi:hypothetical protein
MEPIKLLRGYLDEMDVVTINKALEEAKQEGRKEVVDWVRRNKLIPSHKGGWYGIAQHLLTDPDCSNCKWQVQLKEWGIE